MAKILVPAIASGAALAMIAAAVVSTALHKVDVTLEIDGASKSIAVRESTVGEVLELEGIELGAHDTVAPAADTAVSDGLEISVDYGRKLTLTLDGAQRTVWTTADTVGEALAQLQLDDADSKLSSSRSAGITRSGLELEVSTAKDVTLTVGGTSAAVRAAGTVADLLEQEGIELERGDQIEPPVDTVLSDGMEIVLVQEAGQVAK